MGWSLPSLANFIEALIRRNFSSAGLILQTINIDSDTTIEFWGPPPPPLHPLPGIQEKPALLLLHGFGPTATWQWHRQVKVLSPFFRLYVPNLLFFGGSSSSSACDGEEARWSEIFQAECMAKLMEKLGVGRFFAVGTSYGGFVVYHMARLWPEKVEKVVLASSAVNIRRRDNTAFVERARCTSIAEVMLPSTAADLRRLWEFASTRSIRYVPDFILNDFCRKMYWENREGKLKLLKGLTLGRDDTVNLSHLHQEVLVIWGDQDQVFPLRMAHELKEILGERVKLEVIENTSHLPQLAKPEEFNDILMSFLCIPSS